MADAREETRAKLTGKKRGLGPAVKPAEGIRRIRERLFGRIFDWLNVRKRDALLANRRTKAAREEVIGALTQRTGRGVGVFGLLGQTFARHFGRAAEKLGEVTVKLLGADKPLWDEPVATLRKRPSPKMLLETLGGENMIGVNSTNVFSVGWERSEESPLVGIMTIQFRSGAVYEYDDAPRWLYQGLLGAESPGRYVWAFVRSLYDAMPSKYRKVS